MKTLKIVSLNANGIRSAIKKGLFEVMHAAQADIICIQELKCQASDLANYLTPDGLFYTGNANYYFYAQYAEKKGYSGVAILSKQAAKNVTIGLDVAGFDIFNQEGRWVIAEFDDFSIISAYFPSGSSSEIRQNAKFDFLASVKPYLSSMADKPILLCGDLNIAHQEIDLKNWKGNLKNSGFLPEERAWMSELLKTYKDVFRDFHPETAAYTWWSNRGRAFDNDVGWRIDYQIASHCFPYQAKNIIIQKQPKLSDHAWLMIEYSKI